MAVHLQFTVPFDEADGEGIVFFGNYFRLAHRAFEQYLPEIGITWREWFAHKDWGVPLRHVEADYRKPLRPGDAFEVAIEVADIGESSVHFRYRFLKDGELAAELKTSHVFVRRPDMAKLSVPKELAAKLRAAPKAPPA